MEQNNGEIGKKPDKTNPEDLPEYNLKNYQRDVNGIMK